MKNVFKSLAVSAGLLALVLSASGCFALLVGAAAGAGSYAWVQGALVKEYDSSARDLHDAVVQGIKDLELEMIDDQADRISATTRARFADGKTVKVTIEAITEFSARLKIRVGTFGDKVRSEMILEAIDNNI